MNFATLVLSASTLSICVLTPNPENGLNAVKKYRGRAERFLKYILLASVATLAVTGCSLWKRGETQPTAGVVYVQTVLNLPVSAISFSVARASNDSGQDIGCATPLTAMVEQWARYTLRSSSEKRSGTLNVSIEPASVSLVSLGQEDRYEAKVSLTLSWSNGKTAVVSAEGEQTLSLAATLFERRLALRGLFESVVLVLDQRTRTCLGV